MTDDRTVLDLGPPARQVALLLDGVTEDQLTGPTPCEATTIADLLDHLMGLTIAFRQAAEKTGGSDGDDPGGRSPTASAAHLDPDWRRRLPAQLDELVVAWRDPAAWEGMAEAGGVTMPAAVMGRVVVDELVLHGWDLARATGQHFECDPVSTQVVFALGFSGRDRAWTS